jgi:hypothetical protein
MAKFSRNKLLLDPKITNEITIETYLENRQFLGVVVLYYDVVPTSEFMYLQMCIAG